MIPVFSDIKSGRTEQAKERIDSDATLLHITDENGNNVLHHAALADDPDLIYFLLTKGVHLNATNHFHATALFLAAQGNKLRALAYLIRAGADVNIGNQYQATPLFIAAREGLEEVVAMLIEAGADPHITNVNNVTPLDIASHKEHHKIARLINDYARRRRPSIGTEDRIQNILKRTVH